MNSIKILIENIFERILSFSTDYDLLGSRLVFFDLKISTVPIL